MEITPVAKTERITKKGDTTELIPIIYIWLIDCVSGKKMGPILSKMTRNYWSKGEGSYDNTRGNFFNERCEKEKKRFLIRIKGEEPCVINYNYPKNMLQKYWSWLNFY